MLLTHEGKSPKIHETAYIAPNATICGDVTVGAETSVLFGAVITAEGGSVIIGSNCTIMENCVIRGTAKHPVRVEDNVLVGPHAHLSGCLLKRESFVATGAKVFNNAVIGEGAEVRINGTVHVNTTLPDHDTVPIGWVAVGDPCKILPPGEHERIWEIQEKLKFSETVWGLQSSKSGESNTKAITNLYNRSLAKHRNDVLIAEGQQNFSGAASFYERVGKGGASDISGRAETVHKNFGKVSYSLKGHSAFIRMERPEKLNALNEDLWTGLTKAFLEARSDQNVRIVVLQGSGRAFSAGDDIEMMQSWKPGDAAKWMREQAEPLISAILSFDKPIISIVDGLAAGGGCELLMLCDIVIASDRSMFSIPEGLIGAIPPIGSSLGVGYINRAMLRFALTGDPFPASTAKELGFVDLVVDPAEIDSTLADMLEKIERIAPFSLMKMKETVNQVKRKYLDELNFGKEQLVRAAETEDFREGQEAFLKKRLPVWKNL